MPGKRKRSMVDQADVPEEDILFGGQDILYLRDDDEDFKKIINDHLDGLRHEAEDPTFEIDEEDILPEETLAVSDDKELPEHGTHVTEISNDETEEDILFAGQDILYFRADDEDFKKIINNHLDRLRHEAEDPSFEIDEEDILPEETLAVGDDEVLPEHETRVTEISDNEAEFIACGEKGTPLWDADEEAKVQVNRYAYFNRLLPPNEEFAEEAKGVEKPTFDVQSLG